MNFNAQIALQSSSAAFRVEASDEQHRLNIAKKTRASVLPWRGQFSPQLVEFLLEKNAKKGGRVVDPFCGSGTVLYEAAAQGIDSIGMDINPAAISLAKLASICNLSVTERALLLDDVDAFCLSLSRFNSGQTDEMAAAEAATLFDEYHSSNISKDVIVALLMMAFGDNKSMKMSSIYKAHSLLKKNIVGIPFFDGSISAEIGDARDLRLRNHTADYIITSPPYINVFNYHQNYRPIMESLGERPLFSARGEIGANRKFRANRYITVVQYCMDISLFFRESARILKPDGALTIVLGRESKVRGVSFRNGALVAAIASDGLGGKIIEWNERKFINRFGVDIYEDVLTIKPNLKPEEISLEIGRAVGIQGLKEALDTAPNDRKNEIREAITVGETVEVSPYVLKEQI